MRKHPEKEYPESAEGLRGRMKKQFGIKTGNVYAGPDASKMAAVYGGPEYFEKSSRKRKQSSVRSAGRR